MTDQSEERQAAEAPRKGRAWSYQNDGRFNIRCEQHDCWQDEKGPADVHYHEAAHLPEPDPRPEINDNTGWVYDPGQALANLRRAEKAEAALVTAKELLRDLLNERCFETVAERVRAYLAEQNKSG